MDKDQILAFQLSFSPQGRYSIELLLELAEEPDELLEEDSFLSFWVDAHSDQCFSIFLPRFELVLELVLGHDACGDASISGKPINDLRPTSY